MTTVTSSGRSRPRGIRAAAVALSVLALVLPGCDPGAPPPSPQPSGGGLDLSAEAVYGRHAAARGKVDVRIANRGRQPVRIRTLQVQHPLFTTLPPTARESELPPDGRPRLVPVPFGRPRCDRTAATGAVVVVDVVTDDGPRPVTVPLKEGRPGLVREHRRACAVAAVLDVAAVELGPRWTPRGDSAEPVLESSLLLRRRSPGTVTVAQVSGSILFTVAAAARDPVLALPDGQQRAQGGVAVGVARCDPHARIESKTSFTFTVLAAVGDGEPVPVPVAVPAAGRVALEELLDRSCAPATP